MLIYMGISQQRGRTKMDIYPKIEVSNIAVVNVTFRRANFLYNEGRVVVDIGTYDFAGHLANDVVVGFYRNGVYEIHYFYHDYDFKPTKQSEVEYDVSVYEYELSIPFEKTAPGEDFTGRRVICGQADDEFSFTFEQFEPDLQKTYETINSTQDLLIGKNAQ